MFAERELPIRRRGNTRDRIETTLALSGPSPSFPGMNSRTVEQGTDARRSALRTRGGRGDFEAATMSIV
jgi:hypothetical protein